MIDSGPKSRLVHLDSKAKGVCLVLGDILI